MTESEKQLVDGFGFAIDEMVSMIGEVSEKSEHQPAWQQVIEKLNEAKSLVNKIDKWRSE